MVFLLDFSRSRESGSRRPNLEEYHFKVFQMFWSLWGEISWSLNEFSRFRTSDSDHGMLVKPNLCMLSRPRQWMRNVRKRVSPRRSRYSCMMLSPWRTRMCGMSLACGAKMEMTRSAQRCRRCCSSFRWVVADSSFRHPGFQWRHLAVATSTSGGRSVKSFQTARSLASQFMLFQVGQETLVFASHHRREEREASVLNVFQCPLVLWSGELVQGFSDKGVEPIRGGHEGGGSMCLNSRVNVVRNDEAINPTASFKRLRVSGWHALETELEKQLSIRLGGVDLSCQKSITDMLWQAYHRQPEGGSTMKGWTWHWSSASVSRAERGCGSKQASNHPHPTRKTNPNNRNQGGVNQIPTLVTCQSEQQTRMQSSAMTDHMQTSQSRKEVHHKNEIKRSSRNRSNTVQATDKVTCQNQKKEKPNTCKVHTDACRSSSVAFCCDASL